MTTKPTRDADNRRAAEARSARRRQAHALGRLISDRAPSPLAVAPPLVGGLGTAAWVALVRPGLAPLLVTMAVAGALLLVVGLVISRIGPVAVAVALWGAGYVAAGAGRGLDARGAALFGTSLLVVFELSSWSAGTRSHVRLPARAWRARAGLLSLCAAEGCGVAWATGAVAGLGWGTSPLLAVAGGVAALVALNLLVVLVVRSQR